MLVTIARRLNMLYRTELYQAFEHAVPHRAVPRSVVTRACTAKSALHACVKPGVSVHKFDDVFGVGACSGTRRLGGQQP